MSNKRIHALVALAVVALFALIWFFAHNDVWALLQPKGLIAFEERDLILRATFLMLLIVVPVLLLLVFVAWHYRGSNRKAKYTPNWEHSLTDEFIWWAVPCAIIFILAIITWESTHRLDPFKPLESSEKPLTIEVVALNWKWLFIYPEEKIATLNFIQIPVGRPVEFKITADAPMNSFWIPELGGQIYAMTGMSTKLHLVADRPGEYAGSSANFSGDGFAGMKFIAKAVSNEDFKEWAQLVHERGGGLDMATYEELAQPSKNELPRFYKLADEALYDKVIEKFMLPPKEGRVLDAHLEDMQGNPEQGIHLE